MAKILITFALRQEGYPFARKLAQRTVRNGLVLGCLGTREIVVYWLGIGVKKVDLFARVVAELGPHLVVNSGFAGGVRSLLEAGDFVLAKNYSSQEILEKVKASKLFSAIGNFATVEEIADSETKARLSLQGNVLAVDMESEQVATFCRSMSVPFLTAKMISDRSDEAVPRLFIGRPVRNLNDIFDAIHFGGRMLVLRERLATRLVHLLEEVSLHRSQILRDL